MYPTMKHLDDEHMRLYEWSGAGAGMAIILPDKPKRGRVWHVSYALLALLASLLALNGCDRKDLTERAGEQVDQAIQDMKQEAPPTYDIAARSESAGKVRKKAAGNVRPLGRDGQNP